MMSSRDLQLIINYLTLFSLISRRFYYCNCCELVVGAAPLPVNHRLYARSAAVASRNNHSNGPRLTLQMVPHFPKFLLETRSTCLDYLRVYLFFNRSKTSFTISIDSPFIFFENCLCPDPVLNKFNDLHIGYGDLGIHFTTWL
jgi:hypothetical protein